MDKRATLIALLAVSLAGCETIKKQLFDPNAPDERPVLVQAASKPDPDFNGIVRVPKPNVIPDPVPATPSPSPGEKIATAQRAKDKPGFVQAPYGGAGLVDVRGLAPGSLAKDPYTGKAFYVPVDTEPSQDPSPSPSPSPSPTPVSSGRSVK
jgi:hypothetical protein